MKTKHLLIAAAIFSSPFFIAWSFNHIDPWVTMGAILAIVLLINHLYKNK
jgi:hypothetical protein